METGTIPHPRGGLYFEDFSVGQVFRHRLTRTVTQMDNMLFSNMTLNPQPLHIDAHFCATETEWGRPLMNSLFTLGLMIGISVNDTTVGTTIANLGMSEVAFPAPLFEGDTVRVETEVIGARASKSRADAGLVEFRHRAFKQDGALVAECRRTAFMRRRAPEYSPLDGPMRSLIVAPADERRLAEALASGADALVADLALAARDQRPAARAAAARFLKAARARGGGPALIVGLTALNSGETDLDLDAVMMSAPDAILLPRSIGGASVQQLSAKLAVREAEFALVDGATQIIAVVDTARSLFGMASYHGSSARLIGLAWDAKSLRADIGAERHRGELGDAGPYRLARDLTVLAAAAAGVAAIDTAFADVRDPHGLRAEAHAARRDGFARKMQSTRFRRTSSTTSSRHAQFAHDPSPL